ncbi:kirola-like [Corylus avellana]|uniref:kirola-like n=1 Tax=Corylus avellana TaxID=13451 RepID=UPI00286D4FA9|nr:kirola-like [Corylus avellana]XP_059446616.1 kirola-like [Corylus avellana]
MAQVPKLVDQRDRKCSGEKFFEIFRKKANLLPTICPNLVKDIQLVEGNWESKASIKKWTMVVAAGKSEVNVKAESGEDTNKSYTYVIGGEVTKKYKSLVVTFLVTTKHQGCSVTLTIAYEPNVEGQKPTEYLNFYISVMNDVEEYLLRNP